MAQIALRFLYENRIVVITNQSSEKKLKSKENLDIFDFELTGSEMRAIEELEVGRSFFGWW